MRALLTDFLTALEHSSSERQAGEHLLLLFQNLGADGGNIWFSSGIDKPASWNSEATSYSNDCLDFMYGFKRSEELIIPKLVANSRQQLRGHCCKKSYQAYCPLDNPTR